MTEKKKRILKGRVILALHNELGRKPTTKEIELYYRAALGVVFNDSAGFS